MDDGVPPMLITCASPRDAVERLANELIALTRDGGMARHAALVIYGDNVPKLALYERLKRAMGAGNVWWFNEKKQKKAPPRSDGQEHLRMAYVDTATGLEAGVVFLIGVDPLLRTCFNVDDADAQREESMRKLYMAMTRAAQRLVVLASQRLPPQVERLFDRAQPTVHAAASAVKAKLATSRDESSLSRQETTMDTRRRFVGQLAFGTASLAAGLSAATARAQAGTLTILVGYNPGGGSDILARTLADAIGPALGRTVVVDNKPGAGGRIAATMLKSAAADGSVVMIAPNGLTSIQTLVYKEQIKYDPAKDFAAVAKLASTDLALAVSADLKINDAKALSDWVKANPTKASFGSPAAGGLPHFAGLLLGKTMGVELNHIPYKGGAPTAMAVAGGEVPMGISGIDDFVKLEQGGKVKIIGSMGGTRSAVSPNVPTLLEQGVKLQAAGWSGMWAPAGTPDAELRAIATAVQKALQMDSVKQKLSALYTAPDYAPGADLLRLQQAEWDLWAPIIKASGFKPE